MAASDTLDTSRRRRRARLAGLLALLLVTTACGARWTDEQRAGVLARHDGGPATADGPVESADAGRRSGTTTTVARGSQSSGAGGATATTAPAGGQASSGEGQSAQQSGEGGAGALPCTAPSDEVGITDDTITIGSISTLSGPVPGLGASADAATRAYVAFRNATGGVCGREVVLKAADDGADNGRYRSIVQEMIGQVVGVAGGFAAADPGGADVVEQNKFPLVSTVASDQMQAASTVFDTNPPFADVNAPITKFDWLREQGATKAALVWIDVEQSRAEIVKQRAQMKASGIKIVHENPLPLSTLSYDSAARGVANSGANYLFFLADSGASASMAKSMADTDHEVKFPEYLTAYGSNFIELAGGAAESSTSWIRTLPAEDKGSNAELDTYLDWMARVAPDIKPDTFAADAWAGTKAFLDGLEALPGPISRDAVLAQLRSMDPYDADGMMGPIRLGSKLSDGCFVAMQVSGGGWKRLAPGQGFMC